MYVLGIWYSFHFF